MGGFADIINRAAQAGVNKVEQQIAANPSSIPSPGTTPESSDVATSLSNLQAIKTDMQNKGTATPEVTAALDQKISEYQSASGVMATATNLIKKYWWIGAIWAVVIGGVMVYGHYKKK